VWWFMVELQVQYRFKSLIESLKNNGWKELWFERRNKFFGNSYKLMVIKLCGVGVVSMGFG